MEIEESPKMKQMTAVIQGVTTVVTASIPVVDENINYKALLECALILNGIFYALSESEKVLQGAIQQLCGMWWEKGLEGKEQLGKTAFIMLLRKSLKSKTVLGADIVRLWHLHQMLLCFDYDLEESYEVKDLLLQCFMSVNHIKKEELLSYFHKQSKVRQGVEEMLHRLYQPILWRALKARNSEVRSNAALLFVEAFPIRDPHFNNEAMDNEIQKQFEELFSLLEDPHPLVRSTGVLGVSKITSKYWDMIPATILAELLKKLIGDLAFDVTSADVRCSVFKCLPIILDNKLSHPLLEQLLPTVKYSLHDNSEKVRVAFVDMLLKIKAVRAAKRGMGHLLARHSVPEPGTSPHTKQQEVVQEDLAGYLVEEEQCQLVLASSSVNLLFNSFLPVNQPEEVWCERCVTLIQMNPAAARKFYQYAYEYTAPTNIAKFMLTIRRCLNACIQRAIKENKDDEDEEEESEKENISMLNNVLSINDVASMASLLEITVILWRSIHKALDHNEEAKGYTIRKFASVLPEYFKAFKDDRCMIPLVILASFMPASAIPTFRYYFLTVKIESNTASERRVRIQVTNESKPELALDYLEYLLTHSMNRDCLLSVPRKKLNQLLKVLGAAKEMLGSIMKATGAGSHSFNQATAIRAFTLYCRLSIHLQHKFSSEGKVYLSHLKETGAWIESHVLPSILMHEQEENVLEQYIEVSQLIIQAYLKVCKDAIMVGLGDSEFQAHLLDVTLSIMQTETPGCFKEKS
ncbi:Condensin-2 complex subunit G2 [Chelonia mydas]|uniref:Condensin-2 complex subunit G2 n=1 Tax=Chelonia mydas TaxID=8469 RepID=M7BTD6_CHEMY|nr:Condensin-2 complex subunit G2 [Chelonia mydas]